MNDSPVFWNIDDLWRFPITYRPITSRKSTSIMVDTDKFDIVPKESHRKEMLDRKEEEIAALEREWESTKKYFEERKKKLEEEREKLTRRSPKSP